MNTGPGPSGVLGPRRTENGLSGGSGARQEPRAGAGAEPVASSRLPPCSPSRSRRLSGPHPPLPHSPAARRCPAGISPRLEVGPCRGFCGPEPSRAAEQRDAGAAASEELPDGRRLPSRAGTGLVTSDLCRSPSLQDPSEGHQLRAGRTSRRRADLAAAGTSRRRACPAGCRDAA
ncbi:hypothetical protein OJAV_G00027610 [Oryzias javanicus]|uniref:Uncharacterized protein n=1 Tax=Oryzias javanicus TaxID=123683 RepID=A0A3S2UNS7_ORYJA|nr:hypothetical protein OJAV_G00027610 [Oryzias javanicus]